MGDIEAAIYESIAADFEGREDAWDVRARGARSTKGEAWQVHSQGPSKAVSPGSFPEAFANLWTNGKFRFIFSSRALS